MQQRNTYVLSKKVSHFFSCINWELAARAVVRKRDSDNLFCCACDPLTHIPHDKIMLGSEPVMLPTKCYWNASFQSSFMMR